ncbi:hypothetical protein T492DRAFT_1034072 [Pavlovales sp. CCMP2436]|nr:hypothetical protein T492DRAFT_1034072 [Pavlovales sp. CCMP2436]
MDLTWDFVSAAAPLVAGMLLVPRLDALQLRDQRSANDIIRNLAYSEANVAQGRWWTQFTYAFVHASEEHLVGNLLSLLPHAYMVHGTFGGNWLPIFFGGVFAGAYDRAGKRYQAARGLSEPLALRRHAPTILEPAADAVDRVTRQVAEWLAPSIVRSMNFVGASAGVWALQGTCLCLSVEQLVLTLWHGDYASMRSLPAMFFAHGISILSLSGRVLSTASSLQAGASSALVDHSGHLDGFIFGIGAYAVLRFVQLGHARRSRRPMVVRGGVLGYSETSSDGSRRLGGR